jgi:hypothetical protein
MDRHGLKALVAPDSRMFTMVRRGARVPHIVLSTVMLLVFAAASFIVVAVAAESLFDGIELFSDVEHPFSLRQVALEYIVPFGLMIMFLWVWVTL